MEEPVAPGHWTEVKDLTTYFRGRLSVPLCGTVAENNRYAKMLCVSMAKEQPKHNHVALIKRLIDVAMEDEFWRFACTSFKKMYFNRGEIMLKGIKKKNEAMKQAQSGDGFRLVKKG